MSARHLNDLPRNPGRRIAQPSGGSSDFQQHARSRTLSRSIASVVNMLKIARPSLAELFPAAK